MSGSSASLIHSNVAATPLMTTTTRGVCTLSPDRSQVEQCCSNCCRNSLSGPSTSRKWVWWQSSSDLASFCLT
eukprot:5672255-Prymnesium_polylepis.1